MLRYFLAQYNLVQVAERSMMDSRWAALEKMAAYFSGQARLSETPVPLLGDTYYSTGSFQCYKELGVRLRSLYYLVSVDQIDLPLFWPLVLHEIAHCKLSETHHLERVAQAGPLGTPTQEDAAMVEARVEEALCDVVATRLIGPAYPYAYLARLWPLLPYGVAPDYPSHTLRIECMATVLDAIGLPTVGEYLRQIRDAKLPQPWEKDAIAPLKDRLVEVTDDLPTIRGAETRSEAVDLLGRLHSNPPSDLVLLFTAAWEAFDMGSPSNTLQAASGLSSTILAVLEGRPKPLDASA